MAIALGHLPPIANGLITKNSLVDLPPRLVNSVDPDEASALAFDLWLLGCTVVTWSKANVP